jgi:4-amino-4-deoxy-L-arabinose transferase-like glycosyltransferase
MNNKPDNRSFALLSALIVLTGFILRFYGLSEQPPSEDDIAVAISAWNYLDTGNLGPTMWNHPPLRNILVYYSCLIFGGGVWGVKSVSLVIGTLSIILIGLLARRLFRSDGIAGLAMLFLAVDALHIDFSRQAVHEIYMMFFTLVGVYFALKYRDGGRLSLIVLSGAFFGLGIASKWDVAVPAFLTALFMAYLIVSDGRLGKDEKVPGTVSMFFCLFLSAFITYLLVFIPWFSRGYGFSEWISLQKFMYIETVTHGGYHPYSLELDYKAYLWFLKPGGFADFIFTGGEPIVLLGVTNPAVWLLAIPSMTYLLFRGVKDRTVEYVFVFIVFLALYVPLLMTERPIWIHTAFTLLPFVFMAISFTVMAFISRLKRRLLALCLYLMIVIGISAPLYLLAIGKGLEIEVLRPFVERYEPSYEWKE